MTFSIADNKSGRCSKVDLKNNGKIVVRALYHKDAMTNLWVKQKFTILIPSGNYDYTMVTDQIVLTDTPEKIVVIIKGKSTIGNFFVDDLSLINSAPVSLGFETRSQPLPLPEAPDSFRD